MLQCSSNDSNELRDSDSGRMEMEKNKKQVRAGRLAPEQAAARRAKRIEYLQRKKEETSPEELAMAVERAKTRRAFREAMETPEEYAIRRSKAAERERNRRLRLAKERLQVVAKPLDGEEKIKKEMELKKRRDKFRASKEKESPEHAAARRAKANAAQKRRREQVQTRKAESSEEAAARRAKKAEYERRRRKEQTLRDRLNGVERTKRKRKRETRKQAVERRARIAKMQKMESDNHTLLQSPTEGCPKKNSMVEKLVYQMEHQDDNSDTMIPTPEMAYVKLENLEHSSENNFQTEDVAEDWPQYNDNNDSFESSENGKEPKAKVTTFDSTEPDTTGKESDDNMFRLLSASDDVLKDLDKLGPRTSNNPNEYSIKHQKPDSEALQEALHCMKALLVTGQERDEYTVFVEHIGNKLRTCNRDSIEIKIAQHHIENIVFNLSMGLYSQTGNDSEATNGSPNFRDFQPKIVIPTLPTYQTAVENIISKDEPDG